MSIPVLQYTVPAFWRIFPQSFCEIQPRVCESNFSTFCERPPHHVWRTGLLGHASRLEIIIDHKRWDLDCMLDAPSLQWRAILATLEQDEPYVDAHCHDGISIVPWVLIISTSCARTISPIQTCTCFFSQFVPNSYTFVCLSRLYGLPMLLMSPFSCGDACLVGVGKF